MSGVYGRKIKMTIFGESHGASIGLVIDGLPPGLGIDIDFIKREMERLRAAICFRPSVRKKTLF
jgi:chorismate synthase